MANYPQEVAQDAVCKSHTGHMSGLWFLPARPLRLNTNELMNENNISNRIADWHFMKEFHFPFSCLLRYSYRTCDLNGTT